MFLYNHPDLKQRRQSLRNARIPAETILWQHLQRSQFFGYKFRRQYGVGPYVLDFFCSELRLAIEIDGDSHSAPDAKTYDKQRQQFIESEDIIVIRFLNTDVHQNVDGVLERLYKIITTLCLPPT
ncbi:MAG: endonuclease domain-containing protein [Candidatus Kerfeldbacteria bacterium]